MYGGTFARSYSVSIFQGSSIKSSSKLFTNPIIQGGPGSVRFGYGLEMERFKRFRFKRFRRFLCKKGLSVFQYSLTGKDGSGFGSWKTVPAVPVPPSVSGKTVPTVLVSGSGSVPEPCTLIIGVACAPVAIFNFASNPCENQQTRVYPYPMGAGSARPNPTMGAPDPGNPLFLGFSVLRGRLRPWSQTMVSEGARPWGRGRSGDCERTLSLHRIQQGSPAPKTQN